MHKQCNTDEKLKPLKLLHTGWLEELRLCACYSTCTYLALAFTENVIGHPPASQLELVLCQESWDAVLELAVYQEGPALAGRLGANSS